MKPTVLMLLCAASLPLGACASNRDVAQSTGPNYAAAAPNCRSVGNTAAAGAGLGGAAGLGVGAISGGVGLLEGALIGAAVGGLAGAIWADSNNDGCVDGYTREGRYYEGAPYQEAPQPTGGYRSGERG